MKRKTLHFCIRQHTINSLLKYISFKKCTNLPLSLGTDTPSFFLIFLLPICIFKQKKVKENEFHNYDSFIRGYYLFLFRRKEGTMLIHLALFIRTPSSLYAACYCTVRWMCTHCARSRGLVPLTWIYLEKKRRLGCRHNKYLFIGPYSSKCLLTV